MFILQYLNTYSLFHLDQRKEKYRIKQLKTRIPCFLAYSVQDSYSISKQWCTPHHIIAFLTPQAAAGSWGWSRPFLA